MTLRDLRGAAGTACGAFLIMMALAAGARAAAPDLLTYQGRLKESGVPVTGSRTVEIQLCSDSGGVTCFTTGVQTVGVTNGVFRSTFSAPSTVDLTTGQWYVRVLVAGTALSPLEQLSAGAYSIYASSASTLVQAAGAAGVSVSTNLFVVNGSSVGIGMTNPQTTLEAGGNSTAGEIRASYLTPTGRTGPQTVGTLGFAALKNGALSFGIRDDFAAINGIDVDYAVLKNGALAFSTQMTDVMTEVMRITGGKVGVGTTSPGYRMDVQGGQINASGGLCIAGLCQTSWTGGNTPWSAAGSVVGLTNAGNNVVVQSTLTVQGNAFSVGGSTLVVANGNVGIGTTNPSAKLNVNYTYPGDTPLLISAAGDTTLGINFSKSLTYAPAVNFVAANAINLGGGVTTGSGPGEFLVINPAAGNTSNLFDAQNGGSSRLLITAVGNVGVGKTNPSYQLDVSSIVNTSHPQGYWQNGTPVLVSSGLVTFVGAGAGAANTTNGTGNTFVGVNAGNKNTSGFNSVFVGSYAGYSNTTGQLNSFLGYQSGYSNTGGSNNAFVGYFAGNANTIGNANAFLGSSAGNGNTTGVNNSFLGSSAGYLNTGGSYNTFAGSLVGYNNNGNFNAFLGYYTGYSNTTGGNNVFLGYNAGYFNTTGGGNVFIGNQAGYYNTTASNQFAVANAQTVAPLIYGDFGAGNVGISTGAATVALEVNGGTLVRSSSTWAGVAPPPLSALNQGALYFDSTARKFMVSENGAAYVSLAPSGASAWSRTAPNVYPTNVTDNVGVGTASPGGKLQVSSGTVIFDGNVSPFLEVGVPTQIGVATLTVTSLGVGVGTTSPQASLHVSSNTILGAGGTSLSKLTFGQCVLSIPSLGLNTTSIAQTCSAPGVASNSYVFTQVAGGSLQGVVIEIASPGTGLINIQFRNTNDAASTAASYTVYWLALTP